MWNGEKNEKEKGRRRRREGSAVRGISVSTFLVWFSPLAKWALLLSVFLWSVCFLCERETPRRMGRVAIDAFLVWFSSSYALHFSCVSRVSVEENIDYGVFREGNSVPYRGLRDSEGVSILCAGEGVISCRPAVRYKYRSTPVRL